MPSPIYSKSSKCTFIQRLFASVPIILKPTLPILFLMPNTHTEITLPPMCSGNLVEQEHVGKIRNLVLYLRCLPFIRNRSFDLSMHLSISLLFSYHILRNLTLSFFLRLFVLAPPVYTCFFLLCFMLFYVDLFCVFFIFIFVVQYKIITYAKNKSITYNKSKTNNKSTGEFAAKTNYL